MGQRKIQYDMGKALKSMMNKTPSRRKRISRGKESQEQAKESDTLTPTLRSPTEHQANSHNILAKDLVKTHTGPLLAKTVSVSQYEPLFVDPVA